jgi:probable F420-dependent oxidoreductase
VFANDFRHPLILAREAATLDRLSGGRLELGLGAGWMRSDYRKLGMEYDSPGRRIDRLAEALSIVKRLLRGETVTHHGEHYRLDSAHVGPEPVQRPHPPIMIGGGGPRLLRLAAREAQIVGLAPQMSTAGRPMLPSIRDAAVDERVEIVRRTAGDRFEDLELNAFVADGGIAGGRRPLGSSLAALLKAVGPAAVGGSPYLLYGTTSQLREALLRRRERTGISSYAIPARGMEDFAPLVAELSGG